MSEVEGLHKHAGRAIDMTLSVIALLVLGLPMLIIAAAIRFESKGPALFLQKRVGRDGERFMLFKFRSMSELEGSGNLFHDEDRVTSLGRIIRKWRIDELPQFINVLKGDMAIVGPRPTLPYQVERYNQEQRRRLEVKPGLTGWAQIHGDEAISWPERIVLDLWYVDHRSIWLDMKIMLSTPLALLKIQRINVEEGPPPDGISELDGE